MSTQTEVKPPRLLRLIKIRQWYLPYDREAYQVVQDCGLNMLKIHEDFLPTLMTLASKLGVEARHQSWRKLFNKYMDKVGAAWLSRAGRKCKLTEQGLVFSGPLDDLNKRVTDRLDKALAAFFDRWGFSYDPQYSEKGNRFKLAVTFSFRGNPVIGLAPEPNSVHESVLGWTKIRVTFYNDTRILDRNHPMKNKPPQIMLEVFTRNGTEWRLAHSQKMVSVEVDDLRPLLAAFAKMLELRRN